MIRKWLFRLGFLALLPVLAACNLDDGPNQVSQVDNGSATATPIPTAPAIARPTYTVQRGTVQEVLEFTGRWEPRDQQELSLEIAGTMRQVAVRRGDQVALGQLLADYQITELEDQLANAELDLETAQLGLDSGEDSSVASVEDAEVNLANARLDLQNAEDSRPWGSVASARVRLDDAQRAVDNAEEDYNEAVSRPESPASTVDAAWVALENARSNLRAAQIDYNSAAQTYNNQDYAIAQANNRVIQAELALDRARTGSGDPTQEQQVRSAQLRIDQIEADIARSSLFAPFDGEVLEVNKNPGDPVQAFETIMKIGIPDPKEAVANLPIGDVQRLSVGLVGICNIINQPDTAVQCVIRQLPASAADADQTTRVAASLENVQSGQLVEVEMPLQVREDVLWLPPAAIRTFQNRNFVVLDTAEGPRSVDVTLGLQTEDRIEIIAGVSEGDVVIGP